MEYSIALPTTKLVPINEPRMWSGPNQKNGNVKRITTGVNRMPTATPPYTQIWARFPQLVVGNLPPCRSSEYDLDCTLVASTENPSI